MITNFWNILSGVFFTCGMLSSWFFDIVSVFSILNDPMFSGNSLILLPDRSRFLKFPTTWRGRLMIIFPRPGHLCQFGREFFQLLVRKWEGPWGKKKIWYKRTSRYHDKECDIIPSQMAQIKVQSARNVNLSFQQSQCASLGFPPGSPSYPVSSPQC